MEKCRAVHSDKRNVRDGREAAREANRRAIGNPPICYIEETVGRWGGGGGSTVEMREVNT